MLACMHTCLYVYVYAHRKDWHSWAQHNIAQHSTAWHGMAWHGMARHGMARHDMVWRIAWRSVTWHGMVWHGTAGYDVACHGMALHGMTWHGVARRGEARHDVARCGMVRGDMRACRTVCMSVARKNMPKPWQPLRPLRLTWFLHSDRPIRRLLAMSTAFSCAIELCAGMCTDNHTALRIIDIKR